MSKATPINEFTNALAFNSDNVFLKVNDRELSFKKFKQFAKYVSTQLKKQNLSENDLVLMDVRDPVYFAAYVFACLHLKLKPALLNSYFKKEQINNVVNSNRYSLFITDQVNHLLNFSKSLKLDPKDPIEWEDGEFSVDLTSEILFFTSGSVRSKTCVLTLENFFFNALGSSENIPFSSKDVWGLTLPLFHVGGFSLLVRGLLAQAQICVLDNNQNYQDQFDKYHVTHISLVSTQFIRYLDQFKGKAPEHILLGGSAIPVTALEKAISLKLPIYKSYGMTEMCSQICTTKKLTSSDDLKYSGHLLNYREMKIEDKKIHVRGPCLFKGYLESNKLEVPYGTDGWFYTRDLGVLEDKNLQVLGRSDRIFQSAGENISPEVIEQELLKLPGVSKAYVCPENDPEYGMRAIAYIEKDKDLSYDNILDQLNEVLSGLYRPKALKPWSESPSTSWKQ